MSQGLTEVTVQLSGNYTMEDNEKLQTMITSAVRNAEEKFVTSKDLEDTRVRTTYLTEPKNADFSTARRVKCLVYKFTETGEVTYGACVFSRLRNGILNETASTISKATMETTGSTTSKILGHETFKKKNIRSTAFQRFERKPVKFTMEFKELYRPVKKMIEQDGKFVEVSDRALITKEEQVIHRIKQMMCDPVNGGVRASKNKKMTTVPQTSFSETEDATVMEAVSMTKDSIDKVTVTMVPMTQKNI